MTTAFQSDAFQIDAFQIDSIPVVVVDSDIVSQGSWDRLRKKNRPRKIRYSDFASRDAYAAALKEAIAPKTIFIEPESPIESDDDHILIAAVSKLIH